MNRLLTQLLTFPHEVAVLWRALLSPATPAYLKLAALALVLYVLSPIDLVPDYLPVAGWIDDLVLIPLVVSWIVSRLPEERR